jgi:HSP20 family molecular chaperone IbpA
MLRIIMSNNKASRISIPGRLIQLLLHDDEFFQEVNRIKKASSAGSFPKYDQWCDSDGFHMEFALAGYAKKDLEVLCSGQELTIRSIRNSQNIPSNNSELEISNTSSGEEIYSIPDAGRHSVSPKIQHGSIVRGIARRNFSVNFFIGQEFDVSSTLATVKDGLLNLLVPFKNEIKSINIEVMSGE